MKKFLAMLTVCAVIGIGSISLAQEAQDAASIPQSTTVENEYSYGTVVSVNKDTSELTISEYDWVNDKEANVTFIVDPKVEVENAASWKDITAGSEVDIEYVAEANGKKIAKYISVYTPEEMNAQLTEEVAPEAAPAPAAPATAPAAQEAPAAQPAAQQ